MADQFELTGSNIKNIAVNSAFLAAADGREIDIGHILRALQNEFQKERETADWRGDGTVQYGLGGNTMEYDLQGIPERFTGCAEEKNSRREKMDHFLSSEEQ